MNSVKQFKKYIVISPEDFEKLKASSLIGNVFTDTEKDMVKVLRNKSLSVSQKLKLYRDIILQGFRQRDLETFKENNEIKNPIKKSIDLKTLKKQRQTQTYDFEFPLEENFKDGARISSTPRKQRNIEDVFQNNFQENFDNLDFRTKNVPSLNEEDEEMEVDRSAERREVFDMLERNSLDPRNIRPNDLNVKNLDNPNRSMVMVENTQTGEQMHIPKTPAVVRVLGEHLNKRSFSSPLAQPDPKYAKLKSASLRERERVGERIRSVQSEARKLKSNSTLSPYSTRSGKIRWSSFDRNRNLNLDEENENE
jgi:hypothetical protein